MVKEKNNFHELQKLKESMAMMEELLDNAYYGMVLVDNEGYIVKWNYEKFLGIPEKNVLGKHVKEVIENTRLHIVAKTGKKELCDIQEIQGKNVITSRIPIIKDGKPLGAAGTIIFSDTSELQGLAKKVKTLEDALDKYKGELSKIYETRFSLEDIATNNFKMTELKTISRRIAKTNSTVLIQGESGTGKELFAHGIHKESLKKYGNFVTVNCAAIPKELLESELFGYEEGAFTGSKKGGKIGKFELANGGTILLDEIGSMPLDMQSKLLRILEAKEFERIGGNRPIPLDARVISSTNENLEQEVQKGNFRRDLYYRLNVIRLEIPPLRDRVEDIDIISKRIVEKLSVDLNIKEKIISIDAMELLRRHKWPGNVRELRNVLERAINFAPNGVIDIEHLPDHLVKDLPKVSNKKGRTLKEMMEEAEVEVLKKAIREAEGNRTLAAQRLNIHRTSLYKKLDKFGIVEFME